MSRRLPTKTKHCLYCGQIFSKDRRIGPAQWESQRFCSKMCGIYNRCGEPPIRIKVCIVCGEEFTMPQDYGYKMWEKQKCCSWECRNKYVLGKPHKNPKARIPLADRFWAKIDKNGPLVNPDLGPCWRWLGYTNPAGYGQIGTGHASQCMMATHASLRINKNLEVPTGKLVRHLCNNPPCTNPDHLAIGTPRENYEDAVKAGTAKTPPVSYGPNLAARKLSDEQVLEILELWKQAPPRGQGRVKYKEGLAKRYGICPPYIAELARGTERRVLGVAD